MKKINWKVLNLAFWIEVILSYLIPFKKLDKFKYQVGFPIPFITIYNRKPDINPLMSMYLNPLGLLSNGIIIYFILLIGIKVYQTIKLNCSKRI